jgi:glutamate racemase
MNKKEILVFDTGAGAYLISDKLKHKIKGVRFKVITDKKNAPYGNKTDKEILSLITKILSPNLKEHKYCIIACNTATVNVIDDLRVMYPNNVFFGVEPMIKTARLVSKTKNIMILATESTKKSNRYLKLTAKYGSDLRIFSPDTSAWASLIDSNNKIDLEDTFRMIEDNNCDTVILGCTHYLKIEDQLIEKYPELNVLEPSQALSNVILNRIQYD